MASHASICGVNLSSLGLDFQYEEKFQETWFFRKKSLFSVHNFMESSLNFDQVSDKNVG